MVVFDPRRTETAKVASEHHFVRPGTDAFVLLAMLHVILAEGLAHVPAYVDGLAAVEAAVAAYTPERRRGAQRGAGRRDPAVAGDLATASGRWSTAGSGCRRRASARCACGRSRSEPPHREPRPGRRRYVHRPGDRRRRQRPDRPRALRPCGTPASAAYRSSPESCRSRHCATRSRRQARVRCGRC